MSSESRFAQVAQHREDLIAQHGWMVQSVFPTADMPGPTFAYTIGLHDKGVPELIQVGLPANVGHQLLNDVAKLLIEGLAQSRPPLRGKVEHPRWPMAFYLLRATTENVREWATGAWNRSEGQAMFLQVCWPDKAGRFPWEPEFDNSFAPAQPVLGFAPNALH